MWTAWDRWTDDPELDAERYFADPAFEDWDERIDRLQREQRSDFDFYEYKEDLQ